MWLIYLLAEVGGAASRVGGCGLLDMKDIELCQLPVVTERGEGGSPEHTARDVGNWRRRQGEGGGMEGGEEEERVYRMGWKILRN